ncbi:MAG: 16S rRNA (cytidine(1402)-2'-O)-methyltransferase [Candidatus Nealsonbacteria bacterium]|nr:16S rRNA (cytidine(1402)-2'-O)-methyltransferase [Candidatus Nealsonbacteria bacterium]
MDKGQLYIVATPIGNLKDITLRALDILKSANLILCEDTRVTMKLLNHFEIKNRVLSYHQHSDFKKTGEIIDLLKQGKRIALVCDAGTPGISDPGGKLIEEIITSDIADVIPIPGPSALTAAISISGISMDKLVFMGFPPMKNKRNKYFENINNLEYPVVLYESSHRILKTLKDLENIAKNPDIIVFRELTKVFETVYRGKAEDISEILKKEGPKGEFVVIIKK